MWLKTNERLIWRQPTPQQIDVTLKLRALCFQFFVLVYLNRQLLGNVQLFVGFFVAIFHRWHVVADDFGFFFADRLLELHFMDFGWLAWATTFRSWGRSFRAGWTLLNKSVNVESLDFYWNNLPFRILLGWATWNCFGKILSRWLPLHLVVLLRGSLSWLQFLGPNRTVGQNIRRNSQKWCHLRWWLRCPRPGPMCSHGLSVAGESRSCLPRKGPNPHKDRPMLFWSQWCAGFLWWWGCKSLADMDRPSCRTSCTRGFRALVLNYFQRFKFILGFSKKNSIQLTWVEHYWFKVNVLHCVV